MLTPENLISTAIFVLLPLAGLLWFVLLCRTMRRTKLTEPPETKLFFLFITYGGLLQYFLTQIAWGGFDFGLAIFGALYLLLVAPVLMVAFAYDLRKRRKEAPIFSRMYWASILYFAIAPIAMFTADVIVKMTDVGFQEMYPE